MYFFCLRLEFSVLKNMEGGKFFVGIFLSVAIDTIDTFSTIGDSYLVVEKMRKPPIGNPSHI